MDVVPVEEETLDKWTFDPFSGKVQDGFIWGRGLLDDKGSLVAMMEAAESLITEKFVPERDIYLVFGHDEEIGGRNGAAKIASLLLAKGVKPEFVLDEGGVISKGIMPGVQQPLALVGISEKGYASVELTSAMAGGHSSMPQQETPILLVSRAVSKLVENQFPAEFSPPLQSFMEYVGPEMPLARKAIFANRWLFKPMILGIYEQSNSGNALVRTTTAPTIFRSGVKDNVLPNLATATVNFRILPGTTSGEVLEHVKEVIADERITVRLARAPNEPSPVSGVETPGFKALTKTIRETFPETIVSPYLVIGATDGRYFAKITSDIYRFAPFTLTPEDLERVHGINERISIRDYHASINFYLNLIRNL
jgi:carboxypeptidase PM20D1